MAHKSQKRKKSSNIISGIGTVLCLLFAFMLLCNLSIIIKGTINEEVPPSVFGITPLVVLSGSMSGDAPDHIETGDLIFAKRIEPKNLIVGDIISFMQNSSTVTHRITEINVAEDGALLFTTMGDANNTPDEMPVSQDAVLGKCIGRIAKAGDVIIFMQTPLGMFIFVGLPLFAFIVFDIIRRQRIAAAEKRKNARLMAEVRRLRQLNEELENGYDY